MIVIKESKRELATVLKPLIFQYKKPSASNIDVVTLIDHLAAVLDTWDYTAKEVQLLDKKAFFDLVGECYKKSINKQVYTKVFDF